MLVKRANNNDLMEKRTPIQRKLATFEGDYIDSRDVVVSPLVSRSIELICSNISNHTRLVTSGCIEIRKMILYFKVNTDNRIKLLFCSELKINEWGSKLGRSSRVEQSLVTAHGLTNT